MKYVAIRFRIISGINRILLTEKLGSVDAWARQSEAFLAAKTPRINDVGRHFNEIVDECATKLNTIECSKRRQLLEYGCSEPLR